VSITPLGVPVVPEEYGRVDRDGRLGGGAGEQVDEGAVAGRAVADEDLPYVAARPPGRPAGGVEERGDGDDPAGRAVRELPGELLLRGQRVRGGDRGAGAGGGVEGDREGDGVGAVQGDDVALADTGLGERGGDPAVEAVDLRVAEGGAVGAVDQGRGVAELGGPGEDGLVDGQVDRWDVCVLAAEHGSSRAVSTTWEGPGSGGRRS
jgi:hypothetical protein